MGINCTPLLAYIFLYLYEAEFIQSLLSNGRKHLASRFNFTFRKIDDVLSINNPEFENYLGQIWTVELEIKDTTESNSSASYLGLLLRSGGTVQPRPPMSSLFRSLHEMLGLAPLKNVLSWGRRDFQISFSNRDTSRNAWNRHWGSFMVNRGSYQTIWNFPLTNVKWQSVTWPYTMKTLYWSDFVPNSNFYRILIGFHRTFSTGVACRQGTLTPPDTWSRPFGTYIYSFPNLSLF